MLLEALPDHVKALDSAELVQLMKRLLLSEARLAGIPLRNTSVPLQITVPDGGEDARIEWVGGAPATPYVPSRFTILQAKASNLEPKTIRDEVRKASGSSPALSEALKTVLDRAGAYIIFCGRPLVNSRRKKLIQVLKEEIEKAGEDTNKAEALDIYDANLIADWVNSHPPVALWLASRRLGRPLHGFQTFESWGRTPYIEKVPWQISDAGRYRPSNQTVSDDARESADHSWSFDQARDRIRLHLQRDRTEVRISGPSGYGKTRFIYEVLRPTTATADQIDAAAVIAADGSVSGTDIVKLALEMAGARVPGILVVDECNDELHHQLSQIVQRGGARLRLISLDIDSRISATSEVLSLRLERAPDTLIQSIARGVAPTLRDADERFIAELAEGFPGLAVLAAREDGSSRRTLESVDQVIDRIVWGSNRKVPEAERALEVASLFEWIGIEGTVEHQAKWIAEELGGMTLSMFVEHLLSLRSRGVVQQRGDFIQVGPIPLAARLGLRRLAVLTTDRLVRFFQGSNDALKASLLRRMQWLDTSATAATFAERLLAPSALGNLASLNTKFGSKYLERLVHIAPDSVMDTVERVYGPLSTDELVAARDGRRYLVWTLEKLVFRKRTFDLAARLLQKLAIAENEKDIGNNATGQYVQLFQLYLSGTEAPPDERLRILDESLASHTPREREICMKALTRMLQGGHFSRSGGAEQIGSNKRMEDWRPTKVGQIREFYRAALSRLTAIALSNHATAAQAKKALGSHIRGLIHRLSLEDVREMISKITASSGFWPEAITGVSSWLYFDRKAAPAEFGGAVRAYFDTLLPDDPIDAVHLYSVGWHADLHDPDSVYDPSPNAKHDFEYSQRMSEALAVQIASNQDLLHQSVERFACGIEQSIGVFARRIAEISPDPECLFTFAIEYAAESDAEPSRAFFGGIKAGLDVRDPDLARSFVRKALEAPKLRGLAITLVGSGRLRSDDIGLLISLLREKAIEPGQCVLLSYGRGLDHFQVSEFLPLLAELESYGANGTWTVLEMIEMFLHGGKVPAPELITVLKRILVNRTLLKDPRDNRDAYHLQHAVELLAGAHKITPAYAKRLAIQLLSICRPGIDRAFYQFENSVRKCLGILMQLHPVIVWPIVMKRVESRSWHVRFYAEGLLSERYGENHLTGGTAFHVPLNLILDWVREKPETRAPLAVKWIPIAVTSDDGTIIWSSEMKAFVEEFFEQPDFLDELSLRLRPSSWSGSIVPHLETATKLLAYWKEHPKTAVRSWASQKSASLLVEIQQERKRDEEDVVRYV